nr:hypothetical protein [Tanacetum cinerariifolium]
MMHLVPIEEVYVEALQVKHPIIDWKVYIEGHKSYWKITRKGLALVMISYKLQVENYSQMVNDLILKIYKIANSPRQQGIAYVVHVVSQFVSASTGPRRGIRRHSLGNSAEDHTGHRGPNSTSDFNTFPSSPPFDSDAFRGQPSEELLPQIHQELERRMEEMGIDLPSGISVEYFTYHVLFGEDEAGVLDPTFLTEVLADLQQPGHIVSWQFGVYPDATPSTPSMDKDKTASFTVSLEKPTQISY